MIEEKFADVWKSMQTAMDSLENGGNIDMGSIESKARDVCAVLAGMHPTEAKKYEGKLTELIKYLTSITDKLEVYKDLLEDKISVVNNRGIAHNAYGKVMSMSVDKV